MTQNTKKLRVRSSPIRLRFDDELTISDSSADSELAILLSEYTVLRQDIEERIDGQRQLTNLTVVLIGAGIGLIGYLISTTTEWRLWNDLLRMFFLITPMFFAVLMWIFLREDAHIYLAVLYTSVVLRERIERLVGVSELLGWEHFVWRIRSRSTLANRVYFVFLAASRYLLPLLAAVGSLLLYFAVNRSGQLSLIETVLFSLDVLVIVVVLVQLLALQMWVNTALDPDNDTPAVQRFPLPF